MEIAENVAGPGESEERKEIKPPPYRSVSQHNLFKRCAYAYYLSYILKVWKRPAAWLVQGIAVHEAMEHYQTEDITREQAHSVYEAAYGREAGRLAETTPDFNSWFASGPYRGGKDLERRFHIGHEQLDRLIDFVDSIPEKVWVTPDGTPAVELEFNVELGGVPVKGFIDMVVETPEGDLIVRDIKTGNQPGDHFQLSAYAAALRKQYGVTARRGDYLMGKTGKVAGGYDITVEDMNLVEDSFAEVNAAVLAGEFSADPTVDKCRFCDVAAGCEFAAVEVV